MVALLLAGTIARAHDVTPANLPVSHLAGGGPANLVFGDLADDDMCILPGLDYRDPDAPAPWS